MVVVVSPGANVVVVVVVGASVVVVVVPGAAVVVVVVPGAAVVVVVVPGAAVVVVVEIITGGNELTEPANVTSPQVLERIEVDGYLTVIRVVVPAVTVFPLGDSCHVV